MEVKKFKFTSENFDDVTEISSYKFKSLGYLRTPIVRNGYIPALRLGVDSLRNQTLEIPSDGIACIYIYSPLGTKRAKKSRGYRTFYEITCKGFSELQYALSKLGYNNYKK